MPADADGSAIVVERAEQALVVRAKDADTRAVGFAATLPPEPSRTTVVVDASAAGALQALDERLLGELVKRLYADAPPGWEMRLVAARTGRPDPSGGPPLAARLADRLGVGVVAPDGELIALRGGELFSAGPGAGWLGFRRDAHPEWTGPRYPAPAWQAALPREFRTIKPRAFSRFRDRRGTGRPVTVTAIPAGLWVRGAGTAPLPLVDLGFGVPVEAARPIVLVGAPGERGPGIPELTAFYQSLPPAVRENAALVPYGQAPGACATLAQGLADRLETTVRAYHALPHYATDGTRRFAVFNETGTPERLTQTPESVYTPAGVAGPRPWEQPYAWPEAHRPGVLDVAPTRRRKTRDDVDDDLDPVVFESSIDPPTQPIAALQESALPAPAAEDTWTAVVAVDADGTMRPVARTAPGRGLEPWTVVPPARQETTGSAAPEPVTAARASAPAALRTTASTALPRTRPATRPVPMRAESPATDRPPDRLAPYAAPEAGPSLGAPGVRVRPKPPGEQAVPVVRHGGARRTALGEGPAPGTGSAAPVNGETTAASRPAEAADVPVAGSWQSPEMPDRTSSASQGPWDSPTVDSDGTAGPVRRVSEGPWGALESEGGLGRPADGSASHAGTPSASGDPSAWARVAPPETPAPSGERPAPGEARPGALVEPAPAPGAPPRSGPGASLGVPRLGVPRLGAPRYGAPQDSAPQDGAAYAPAGPVRDYDRLWLADRVSTPDERQAFRGSLGWRYDAATRAVARLLAEHPGLRSAELDEALMTEFAAVRVFANRDEATTVESIRAGGLGDDRVLAVCAAGGLRRLPALQGVVVRGGPADPGAADAYRPGQDLIEAAPIVALDDLGASVPGGVETLIWSATARRLDGFAEGRPVPEVVFLPGTAFRVIAVDPPAEPGAPRVRRVLLTEVPSAKAGPGHEKWTARVTGRLQEAAANRTVPPAQPDDRFAALPGDPARSMP